jgi:photosystem II stability/assembly factor-like uncharacterized protein
MKNKNLLLIATACIAVFAGVLLLISSLQPPPAPAMTQKKGSGPCGPAEWYYLTRTNPGETFDTKAYKEALQQAASATKSGAPGTNAPWTLEGPTNINGRINCIAVHPQNNQIIFTGSASGGVFKSTNGGSSYTSIFDDFSYLAVGDITFNPKDPNTMYVGTGDPNISGYPFIGNGVYKTIDGGATWNPSGLGNTYIISDISVHPKCPDTLYAASMGLPFVRDNNRGLYKSTDGGANWTQILFLSNQAGIIELVMDPVCPDTLYAAGWDRIRNNTESLVSGTAAKIYRTTNGGQTWTTLTNGLPTTDMSRIGLHMSGLNHNTLFASIVNPSQQLEGIYKTTNAGNTWTSIDISGLPPDVMGGFGWYFGQIRVNPANDNDIFILGVDLWRTTDGGTSWNMATPSWDQYIVHADKHDMIFLSPTSFLLAADGGLYKSVDNGLNWTDADVTPSTQIYRVNFNPHVPGEYYGGAQDNGTLGGSAAQPGNWIRYMGGDGFQPIFDPYDPSLRYYETQNGALYYDDGMGGGDFTLGIDPADRRSWDMPVIMSRSDNYRMYTGTYRVYKIPDAPYGTWVPISGDLTDGVIYGDRFHVITTVEESPVNPNILYAGTSDANVWYSPNAGTNWYNVTGTLPQQYVTHVVASPTFVNTVYVAHSGYRSNDFIPHIHRSANNGTTWTDLSSNLPPLAINNIEVPAGFNDQLIFAATDGGVYVTTNAGIAWSRLGNNMPLVAVYDIVYDTAMHKLVAGTYGRAIQSYDLDSLIQILTTGIDEQAPLATSVNLRLYPNPCSDYLYVEIDGNKPASTEICIMDLSGKTFPCKASPSSGQVTLDISGIPSGVFLVQVFNNKKQLISCGKFVKTD